MAPQTHNWVQLKSQRDIASLDRAAAMTWAAMSCAARSCLPGVSTQEVASCIARVIDQLGARAAFKHYQPASAAVPFSDVACVSVNEALIHALPSERTLRAGDLVSIDVGVEIDGFFGDLAQTVVVPGEDGVEDALRAEHVILRESARATVAACVRAMKPGVRWSLVAAEARATAARYGTRIVPGYCGHGIGRSLHEPPRVLFETLDGQAEDFVLLPGMVLTIEPIVVRTLSHVVVGADHWTVRTRDGASGCHVERMVAITRSGVCMLGAGWQHFLPGRGL